MKKIITIILLLTMLCGLNTNVSAYSGTGTESNPYVITTPDELMNMKNDLSAHYILGNSIDMSGVWYEPVGNEIDGAFTGSLDGRGYTIRNLDLDLEGSKYVGLFGYLDGTVKNVNLTGVVACGYKYVGGIAGYADENSYIYNCGAGGEFKGKYINVYVYTGAIAGYVNGGYIEYCTNTGNINNSDNYSPTDLYSGGIVGYGYNLTMKNCINSGNISSKSYNAYAGGIIGYNLSGKIEHCCNNGTVLSDSNSTFAYAGGIVGYDNGGLISYCTNNGTLSSPSYAYVGGIVGYCANGTTENCVNKGNISASYYYYNHVGGIVGLNNNGKIKNCVNNGNISASSSNYNSYTGGMVGYNSGGSIENCVNSGNISASSSNYNSYAGGMVGYNYHGTIKYCVNNGRISSDYSSGGISGEKVDGEIIDCINTGYVTASCAGGITRSHGGSGGGGIVRCLNTGIVQGASSGGITEYSSDYGIYSCYNLNIKTGYNGYNGILLAVDEFTDYQNFESFDFEKTWLINADVNSGFPMLSNLPTHMVLNDSIKILEYGDREPIYAFYDGDYENVTWSTDNSSIATVTSSGIVYAKSTGVCTVTATSSDGMKANCLIYVYDKAENIKFVQDEYAVAIYYAVTPTVTQTPNEIAETLYWESDNTDVATVDKYTGEVIGKKSGTANITATTILSGVSASCKVKVTGKPVTNLYLSHSSVNINKDDNLQLTVSVNPSDYEGQITWKSSDESIATVDNNGLVTAKYPGIANIYAQSESGVTTQCTVTVKAPATEIKLNKSELTLQTGYTEKLLTDMLPEYTTDIVSWASSIPSYASVSADGTVTAKAVGQVIITATTTSGEKAHCTVNIVNPPIPVTSVTLDKTQLIMTKADTAQLNATVLPDNATDKNLIWASSDESVATVNSTGVVTAVASGSAIISATSANGYYHECSVQVIAANGASFVATSTKAMPGDIAEYTVSVVKNPGMSYYKLSLKYDNMLLEPIEIINKNTSGNFSHNLADDEKTGLNLMWFSQSDNAENTDLFTIRFRVSDYAKLGEEIPIAMSYGESDIKNSSGNKLAFFLSDASIAVKEPLPGDVNEDGEIDFFDITALSRGVAEIEELTARQMIAADVNDDSVVDIKDNVKLLQYVVGWSGVELMSIGEDEPTINISTEKINEAGEADINVSVKGNTGFSGFKFVIEYNPEEVEILSVTPNENILPERFLTNFGLSDKLVVTWYNTNDINSNGTLFTLRVKTKDGFNGEYSPIRIAYADNNICDDKLENVDFFYNEGYVMTDDYIVLKEYISDTEYACVLKFAEVQKEQDAKAIIAFYDENGKFVQLASSDITVNPDMVEIYMDFDKKAYSTYKLMIWEGFDNLKPIVKTK